MDHKTPAAADRNGDLVDQVLPPGHAERVAPLVDSVSRTTDRSGDVSHAVKGLRASRTAAAATANPATVRQCPPERTADATPLSRRCQILAADNATLVARPPKTTVDTTALPNSTPTILPRASGDASWNRSIICRLVLLSPMDTIMAGAGKDAGDGGFPDSPAWSRHVPHPAGPDGGSRLQKIAGTDHNRPLPSAPGP
jgi:hypothetical protein